MRRSKSNVKLIKKGTTLLSFKLSIANGYYGKDTYIMKLLLNILDLGIVDSIIFYLLKSRYKYIIVV